MEGVGNRAFRRAMATIGGFDEAVTDFIRVPMKAHVESLARAYWAEETAPIPLAAQLMGSDPALMAAMTQEIEKKGAPRIDLNCGCPSNTVTGKGAGSSLLKEPEHLHAVACAMVKAAKVPVTLKMRSGFEDISLFKENLFAAQESGIHFLTLHPRTKVEGYGPPAHWNLIAEAKALLKIPVIGNGDILTVDDAFRMKAETQCDGLMIGRGALINPFLFQQIRARQAGKNYIPEWRCMERYFTVYQEEMSPSVNQLKQLMGFHFKRTLNLSEKRQEMLTRPYLDSDDFMNFVLPLLKNSLSCGHG